jgi:hypothetical protein
MIHAEAQSRKDLTRLDAWSSSLWRAVRAEMYLSKFRPNIGNRENLCASAALRDSIFFRGPMPAREGVQ